jgi:predicted DNA-binding transcriptional regulator YafY
MSSKLNRIVQIDALIRSGSNPNIERLCQEFEISKRTAYDDIAYFKDTLRAPIAYSRSRGGYYYNNPTWALPSIIATQGELLAFFLSAELTRRYLGTSFEQPLRSAIAKLSLNLPEKLQLDLDLLTQHFTFQSGAVASADPLLLVALSEAIAECRPVTMTYFTASRGQRNERTIEPYHLYNVRGDWQVIAFDHLRSQFRNFAISNIETWNVHTASRFSRDADFSPAAYLAQGFLSERGTAPVEIVIWFDDYQARYIRTREWHATQELEEHPDGSLTLRFQSGALAEVRRWVMSYGSHAAVLAPPELRADVIAEARAMLARYGEAPELPADRM